MLCCVGPIYFSVSGLKPLEKIIFAVEDNKLKTTPIEEDDSIREINDESVEIVQLSESQRNILKTTWMTLSREFGQGFSYLKNDSED